ncbi:protein-glutamine gamma-glutamyltransferase K-like isoform X2 [Thalassophryne amazonica]|uniref:protein-glutamine gamma-glutamyltransferase K-like isoform X2 n=1 Tax=Thalassophryne amazonica TaxID=390379 RepID=UPI001471ECF7|nr:protein-glutamine gamma-glutamyltransferase K-like isoform X2 [Thalassophryne amazonica]
MSEERRSVRERSTVGRFPEILGSTEEDKEEPEKESKTEEGVCWRWLRRNCPCCFPASDADTLVTTIDDTEKDDTKPDEKPGTTDSDLDELLKVQSIDLMKSQAEQNRLEHHTNLYQSDDFIIRRGQNFHMWVTLSRAFDPSTDKLHLELQTGTLPAVAKGTHVIVPLVEDFGDSTWEAIIVKTDGNRLKLLVNSLPTAVIGRYRLTVETSCPKGKASSTYDPANDIYMLFNPWCEDDTVFMDDEDERKEYVLNDVGLIYYGTEIQIAVRTWDFGQVNSPDDYGVLEGNWSGDYSDGTSPTVWSGSVEILKDYHKYKGTPVKYGQCWVFAGVVTTILRCLGIPSRPVTNFRSAHDTDVSLTTDVYFDDNLEPLAYLNADSIWNFHVWNDCWMARTDLPPGMGGWQAVDATPQETSQGIFRCGPASLAAIRNGQVYLKHDSPFVFAEVNSDKIYWQRNSYGTFTQFHSEKNSVGHYISTKAVGSDKRSDITHLYKHPEGSEEERIAVERACRYGSKSEAYSAPKAEDVSVEVTMDGEGPQMGRDAELTIVLTNSSSEHRQVILHSQVSVMYYTGVHKAVVRKDRMEVDVPANDVNVLDWILEYNHYKDKLVDQAALMLTLSGRVKETQQVLATQFSFRLKLPDLIIKPIGMAKVGQKMAAEISFTNPLPRMLKAVIFHVEGIGLMTPRMISYGDIGRYASVCLTEHFVPTLPGRRKLLASLDCKELTQVHGVVDIIVQEKNNVLV